MSNRFLVTGGEQYSDAVKRPEGARSKYAKLLEVDFNNRRIETLLRYQATKDTQPDDFPNTLFVSATLADDVIYLCTSTELFVYRYPELTLIQTVSYPFFQNIHHAAPYKNTIAVVSTGLDLIVFLDKETYVPVDFVNALGKDPWHKHSRDIDYRKYLSLKPHESHPNFLFEISGQLWVTRFNQMDAVCLNDFNKKINVGVERLHDGCVTGDRVFFTTVNGCIVQAGVDNLKVEEVIDLNQIDGTGIPLGWCRGLSVDGDMAYVGFSRLRSTRIKENLKWLAKMVKTTQLRQTRIAVYNLKEKTKVDELIMPPNIIGALYSIIPIP